MAKAIFVNLPVKNLNKTIAFFKALGFKFNKEFTDKKAACMIIGKGMFAMLITEPFFKTFTKKPIGNAKKSTEVLIAIQLNSRSEVDSMVKKAVKAGGSLYRKPDDHGWMYAHAFADLDGHQWEPFYADYKKRPKQ